MGVVFTANLQKVLTAGPYQPFVLKIIFPKWLPGSTTRFMNQSGNLFSFGLNNKGQLGHGNNENVSTPSIVSDSVIQITAGRIILYLLRRTDLLGHG